MSSPQRDPGVDDEADTRAVLRLRGSLEDGFRVSVLGDEPLAAWRRPNDPPPPALRGRWVEATPRGAPPRWRQRGVVGPGPTLKIPAAAS